MIPKLGHASESPGGLVKPNCWAPPLDFLIQLKNCILNKVPRDADAAGERPPFEDEIDPPESRDWFFSLSYPVSGMGNEG